MNDVLAGGSLDDRNRVQASAKVRDVLSRLRIGSPDAINQEAVFVPSGLEPQVKRPTPITQLSQRTGVGIPLIEVAGYEHQRCAGRKILERNRPKHPRRS